MDHHIRTAIIALTAQNRVLQAQIAELNTRLGREPRYLLDTSEHETAASLSKSLAPPLAPTRKDSLTQPFQ